MPYAHEYDCEPTGRRPAEEIWMNGSKSPKPDTPDDATRVAAVRHQIIAGVVS